MVRFHIIHYEDRIAVQMRKQISFQIPPDETALRELSEGVIEKLKLLTDAEFAELEFPPD